MDPQLDSAESQAFSLHVPRQYRYLALVRDAVLETCLQAGISEFACYQVEMALDEACKNSIDHSYRGESEVGEEIEDPGLLVKAFEHKDRLVFEVVDWGQGVDYDDNPIQNLEKYLKANNERGLGMYIINRFFDHVEYRRDPKNGNRLRLTKHR